MFAYAGKGCVILTDPALSPAERRAKLMVDLVAERPAAIAGMQTLSSANVSRTVMPALVTAVNGMAAAARVAVSEEVTPEEIDSLCASAAAAANSWQLMRGAVKADVAMDQEWLMVRSAEGSPPASPEPAAMTTTEAVAILHQGMYGRHGADLDGPCHHPEHRSGNRLVWNPPYTIDPTMRRP